MDKRYSPNNIEQHWYQTWEDAGYFSPTGEGSPYCIMIPPPNVTGRLHMGHGFQMTLMDALIRYHRMSGDNTLWQVGTDHAGIATQMVVERQLVGEGTSRKAIGREAFLERTWAWKAQFDGNIKGQLRRLGTSVDWTRERFTLDEGLNQAVQKVFIELYNEGLIYRGKRLVNWDPKLQTAISDLEVVSCEEQGSMWHIRYPLAEGKGHLVVATTRPETLLGDTAVAIHPDDTRYQTLIGQSIRLPLTDRTIPIIADGYVDPAFGTGCVKITPGHDFNDNAMGRRHDLPVINIFTPTATLNENAPAAYQGMDRFDAREQVVKDLQAADLIEKIEPHTLNVPRGDRSDVIIEPFLTDQWFVKTEPLAKPAIKAVETGEIKFVPKNWEKTYFQWLNNIEDWCISRQLWWGHRIPAWYDDQSNIYVGVDEAAIREAHQLPDTTPLSQDEDVLDTWFSSALWPFSTLGWPEETPELATFFPTQVLVTGFDIIFFWVVRMVMMSLKFTGEIPFSEVYIHGLIRDSHGKKMSKSKGNILDPIDLIDGIDLEGLIDKRTRSLMQPNMKKAVEKATREEFPEGITSHGTDALRFTFCALATTGRDINFDISRLEGYRNFCNKLWNAARYVLMNTENEDTGLNNDEITLSLADRWIRSRLQNTIKKVMQCFKTYRFDHMTQALYEFTWHDYCDWYLELSKPVLTSEDTSESQKRGTRQTLAQVLEALLRLIHPIMPFITEEIWQQVAPLAGQSGQSIMQAPYPLFDKTQIDEAAVLETEWLQRVIIGIRTIRGEMNIPPRKAIPLLLKKGDEQDKKRLEDNAGFLSTLAKLESINWVDPKGKTPPSATALADKLELHIPLKDFIDVSAETARLKKKISKLENDLARSDNKLQNKNYLEKAPAVIVEKEKAKASGMQSTLQKLKIQLIRINKA